MFSMTTWRQWSSNQFSPGTSHRVHHRQWPSAWSLVVSVNTNPAAAASPSPWTAPTQNTSTGRTIRWNTNKRSISIKKYFLVDKCHQRSHSCCHMCCNLHCLVHCGEIFGEKIQVGWETFFYFYSIINVSNSKHLQDWQPKHCNF